MVRYVYTRVARDYDCVTVNWSSEMLGDLYPYRQGLAPLSNRHGCVREIRLDLAEEASCL
jgi:hypothetical protein